MVKQTCCLKSPLLSLVNWLQSEVETVLLRLFLLFTIVPLTELWLLMRVSQATSLSFTIALVIVTGFIGASLARVQGFHTWQKIQSEMNAGQMPGGALVDGLLIFVAGAVLLTPGILTDLFGFALLIPPIRNLFKHYLSKRFQAQTVVQTNGFQATTSPFQASPQTSNSGPEIIDAEFTRHE